MFVEVAKMFNKMWNYGQFGNFINRVRATAMALGTYFL